MGGPASTLFWSENAKRSEHVEREWTSAWENRVRIIPVLLDGTELPERLQRIHAFLGLRELADDLREYPHARLLSERGYGVRNVLFFGSCV